MGRLNMVKEKIVGVLEYCYNGIPVVRGYCSYKTIIKHSKALAHIRGMLKIPM